MNFRNILEKIFILGFIIPGFFMVDEDHIFINSKNIIDWVLGIIIVTSVVGLLRLKSRPTKSNLITFTFGILIIIMCGTLGLLD